MICTTDGKLFVVRTMQGDTIVSKTSGFMRKFLGKENAYYKLSLGCNEPSIEKLDGGEMLQALIDKEEQGIKMKDMLYVGVSTKPGGLLHLVAASKIEELVENTMAAYTDGYMPGYALLVDTIAGKLITIGQKQMVEGIIAYHKIVAARGA